MLVIIMSSLLWSCRHLDGTLASNNTVLDMRGEVYGGGSSLKGPPICLSEINDLNI